MNNNKTTHISVLNQSVIPENIKKGEHFLTNARHWSESSTYKRGYKDIILPNFYIQRGDEMLSSNKLYKLVFSHSGNLILKNIGGDTIYHVLSFKGDKLLVQPNGRVILYDDKRDPVWVPDTTSLPYVQGNLAFLVDNDGKIKVVRQMVINDMENGKKKEREYTITVWQSDNKVLDYEYNLITQLKKECSDCKNKFSSASMTNKTCNCDTPVASISSMNRTQPNPSTSSIKMNNNTMIYSQYLDKPLQ
jgi:hypothetical protein